MRKKRYKTSGVLREHLQAIGAKGGEASTEKKKAAMAVNLIRARAKLAELREKKNKAVA